MAMTNKERQARWRERVKTRARELNGSVEGAPAVTPTQPTSLIVAALRGRIAGLLAERAELRRLAGSPAMLPETATRECVSR